MSNIKRLWSVVNIDTDEVIYSSFDYSRAKKAWDKCLQHVTDEKGMWIPSLRDLFHLEFLRYDLNRNYEEDSVFQKSLNSDLRHFLDFVLMKSGKQTTTTNNQ